MFKIATLGSCVAWRQTGGCNPDGPNEPQFDKTCFQHVADGSSGYCECSNERKSMKKGCQKGGYSPCNEACADGKADKNNIVYVL